jgi:hypothetical protein
VTKNNCQINARDASVLMRSDAATMSRLKTIWSRSGRPLGFVWRRRPRGSGFKAFTRAGLELGTFPTREAAELAIREKIGGAR